MNVELSKEDLLSLVKGASPYYSIFDDKRIKPYGHFVGGHAEYWQWSDSALQELSNEQLFEIYQLCKDSWKKTQ
jgi:hypothetical protein